MSFAPGGSELGDCTMRLPEVGSMPSRVLQAGSPVAGSMLAVWACGCDAQPAKARMMPIVKSALAEIVMCHVLT